MTPPKLPDTSRQAPRPSGVPSGERAPADAQTLPPRASLELDLARDVDADSTPVETPLGKLRPSGEQRAIANDALLRAEFERHGRRLADVEAHFRNHGERIRALEDNDADMRGSLMVTVTEIRNEQMATKRKTDDHDKRLTLRNSAAAIAILVVGALTQVALNLLARGHLP